MPKYRVTSTKTTSRLVCGLQIATMLMFCGLLAACGGGSSPARRVSLGISASSDTGEGTWAGLTAGEARRLAAALLVQAASCELWTRGTE